MRVGIVIGVFLATLVTAGCSTTISGSGSAIRTSTPPSTRVAARCQAGEITAAGAPFCYPLPNGFTDFSRLTNYGQGWTYRTLVSIGVHDLVEVNAIRLDLDTDALSYAALAALYARGPVLVPGRYTLTSSSPVTSILVDQARAFSQTGVYSSGGHVQQITVYRRHTVLSISCQSAAHVAAVAASCAEVRSQIKIYGLA